MQTEREGCNYLQVHVPAQYRIHNTYTKDSLHNQKDIAGNLQLKIVSTRTTTWREWRVLYSYYIAFVANLILPYTCNICVCGCIKSLF